MAQVMVNFRIDEGVKKAMEQACKEMGLSMTTAFTIFATKVGREKRIPFAVTAEPYGGESSRRAAHLEEPGPGETALAPRREQLEVLCAEIRRSLTAMHTAIPASIMGLSIERVRLLCGDELKDKIARATVSARSLLSGRSAGLPEEKDLGILDEYLDGLANVAEEFRILEGSLIPSMKAQPPRSDSHFALYEKRLSAVSQSFDQLQTVLERFSRSSARKQGSARSVQARLRQAAETVETAYVQTALEALEALVLRHYDALDDSARARLESHYLQTLELTLEELGRAERSGEDPTEKAALCLRAVGVVSQVLSDGGRARREQTQRSLEVEVTALERLAALRGDVPGDAGPEV